LKTLTKGTVACFVAIGYWGGCFASTLHANEPKIDFVSQVVPIFTKLGCNSGGCHGKAAGQNGFKLSLLGFEPHEDYDRIVKESRGRRVSAVYPDSSLLLTKATGDAPHGGGPRLKVDSQEYRVLLQWISQGMPLKKEPPPSVVRLELSPPNQRLMPASQQPLKIQAIYSDGSQDDVTRLALYESNDRDMADVSDHGLVSIKNVSGQVAVMARYRGQVATFRASVPSAREVTEWPTTTHPIDVAVGMHLQELNIPFSEKCDDATFLRRLTLDLTGRLPTVDESRDFFNSPSSDKRWELLERLLASREYSEYFANKWMLILRNRRPSPGYQSANFAFHRWLQHAFEENKPYDHFVRDIVAASGSVDVHPPVTWYRNVADTASRVEDTAQLFLGQRVQCAHCHHHPYEKWGQEDYARFSAFFALVKSKPGSQPDEPIIYSEHGTATVPHPKTGVPVGPAGLDGPEVQLSPYEDPREALVDWMVDRENPYFARALVNRYWKHFFGRGLVEPEDDLRTTNPPSNPELLDVLAKHFHESKYDLKELIRFICRSNCYQLSSSSKDGNIDDRRSFSRFYPKRMNAEVLLDAIDQVAGSSTSFEMMPRNTRAVGLPDTGFESYFLSVFGRPGASTACSCERAEESTLAQSLQLANSKELQAKLAADSARPARLARDGHRTDQEKIEELYLVTLARQPTDEEYSSASSFLTEQNDKRAAFEDLTWVLINSKEFLFNH
jgi:hypothetical protein